MTPFEEPEFESQVADAGDDAGDPAEAFEALRQTVEDLAGNLSREMTTIRKGVEAAFDRIEGFQQPTDYSVDLGRLVQGLAEVQERLKGVEASPILKNGPEHHARALERSGESLVKTAAQQFQIEARDLQRVARDMASQIASARERRTQDRWLGVCGLAGFAAGILAILFLPAILPGPVAPHVASVVMAKPLWQAGMSIMEFDDAAVWDRVVTADELFRANRAEVAACQAAAAKTGKDQACMITVAVGR
ncbi:MULTISPECIES: DUF6118 family protein [unclassified Aureimonas]|uniref:DUF6118 family protein n=1 Tax=unclassified Aureimonas TaxID=2615206 RepID=UPI0006F60BA9|nr:MULTISPECIES: DUF6118 family protein [unclassified Aureimonas]KQT65849.1 hypothetical protein ASG62_21385 [Aureimonas sp. Leaf427]KQT78069.1 hypothetical protein ASG54_03350 [Aureimonas sp. Leaf460]